MKLKKVTFFRHKIYKSFLL